jgi:hypothetical protein
VRFRAVLAWQYRGRRFGAWHAIYAYRGYSTCLRADRPAADDFRLVSVPEDGAVEPLPFADWSAVAPPIKETRAWNGMNVDIEANAGGTRQGTTEGRRWTQRFTSDYGGLNGVKGADGDDADFYMGPHAAAPTVFVIDEIDPKTGKFRQTKSFGGFQTPSDAIQAYLGTQGKTHEAIGVWPPYHGMDVEGAFERAMIEAADDKEIAKPP